MTRLSIYIYIYIYNMYNVRIFLRLKKITVADFIIVYMDDASKKEAKNVFYFSHEYYFLIVKNLNKFRAASLLFEIWTQIVHK